MDDQVRSQYSVGPEGGLIRYWMGWYSFSETFPDTTFPHWCSGSACTYKLKADRREEGLAKGLPETFELFASDGISDEDSEEFYTDRATWVGLVDASDPEAAWAMVREFFPDAVDRADDGKSFCNVRPDTNLIELNKKGRFNS